MDEKIKSEKLSGDRPLIDPTEDKLGYAPLAKHLAKSISSMSPMDSFVMAIFGPWGSGKTTLLNFIVKNLNEKITNNELIHIPFNPWIFSNHEDLIRKFFDQILAVLAKNKSVTKELRKKIAHFADIISESPIPYSSTAKFISKLVEPKKNDIVSIKKQIENLLAQQNKKIFITIDDIDRLSSGEIRQIFQLIKAVVDFPNVIYLIVFDKAVAIKALEEIQGLPGEAYLEKIIQVPFELPMPDKISLRRLLFENLDKILVDTLSEDFDQAYWTNVYYEGIDHFIKTPRDIIRFSNTLSVTYPSVKGEVNPVDFIAIEALRVFCPMAYDTIRNNPEEFAGHKEIGLYGNSRLDVNDTFQTTFISQLLNEDREPIQRLLKRLFPKLESNYGSDWEPQWRRKLRICSPEKFHIYFRLTVPSGTISNVEIKAILELTSNPEKFAKKLIDLSNEKRGDGSTRMSELLERLEDYTHDVIPVKNIGVILNVFFDIGDQLLKPEDERRGMYSLGNEIKIGRLIYQFLKRVDENERYKLLKEAFIAGRSFTIMEGMLVSFGQQHGKWTNEAPESKKEQLITKTHLEELEKIALEKIRNASRSGELIKSSQLISVLYRWREWGGEEDMKSWINSIVSTDEGLIQFLEKFLGKTFSQTMGDVAVRTIYRLDPKNLEPFLDPSFIVERVRSLLNNTSISDNQQKALQQFLKEYDIRIKGKNPESELSD